MFKMKWTTTEDKYLWEHTNITDKELGKILGRNPACVTGRRVELGLFKAKELSGQRNKWTINEIEILEKFSTRDNFLLASELHEKYLPIRTISGISSKRGELELQTAHITEKIVIECQYCHKRFEVVPSVKSTKHFCSRECQMKAKIQHFDYRVYLEVNDEMAKFLTRKGKGKNNYLRSLIEEDMKKETR